jgi:hypothetical protein
LLFNFASDYTIRKVLEYKEGLELNGTHQLLVCADDINSLGKNTNITMKNIEALLDASKEDGLEVNAEKSKLSICSCHQQSAGQNHNIKVTNKSFENVEKYKYLEKMITNQN